MVTIFEFAALYDPGANVARAVDETRARLIEAGYKVVREKDRGVFRPAYPLDGRVSAHSYSFYLRQARQSQDPDFFELKKAEKKIEKMEEVLRTLLVAVG